MINRTEMLNAMEQLCKAGIVKELRVHTYTNEVTGNSIGIDDEKFYFHTTNSLVYYFYDNLSSVILYALWGTPIITLQVTPKKATTGNKYYEDSFHFATYKPTSVSFQGYIMNNSEE